MAIQLEREIGRNIFGRDAAGYDNGRLDYPEALFEVLRDRCGLGPGCRIFEIGPGTGQATRQLLSWGPSVVATEPDPALAAALAETPILPPASLEVINDTFENAALADGAFDLGVAATSFGWVDKRVGLPKIRRVLKSGGWWAMWWNIFRDVRGDPIFERAMLGAARPTAFTSSTHYSLDQGARLGDLRNAGLVDADYLAIERTLDMTPASLRALYATFSPLRVLAPAEFAQRLALVEGQAEAEAVDGVVQRVYRSTVYLARNP
jgi:SAM-dependent methyltransferase